MKQLLLRFAPLILVLCLLMAGCSAALAQELAPLPAALPAATTEADMMVRLVAAFGWPGALTAASWVLSRALSKWRPTIRIVLVDPEGRKADAPD